MLQRPWLAALIGIALFAGVIGATYGYLEAEPSPVVGLGLNLLCFLAVALWVKADAREHQMPLVFDWGFLGYVAWPVMVPWYAMRTRGRRGWRLTLGLFAAMLAPYVGIIVGVILGRVPGSDV